MLSQYKKDIQSIQNRRNHIIAHDTGKDFKKVIEDNQIASIQGLLQCIIKICCDADHELHPNAFASNAEDFDDWCRIATESTRKICGLNNQLIQDSSIPIEKEDQRLQELYAMTDEEIMGLPEGGKN
jgi:hypothetical protein